jgi:hypothetical protein
MGCSCKTTPLQRTERKIQYWGWQGLAPSDLKVIDNFIMEYLQVVPSSNEERQTLYSQAKNIQLKK